MLDGDEVPSAALVRAPAAAAGGPDVRQYVTLRGCWLYPDARQVLDELPWSADWITRLVRNEPSLRFPGIRHVQVDRRHAACLRRGAALPPRAASSERRALAPREGRSRTRSRDPGCVARGGGRLNEAFYLPELRDRAAPAGTCRRRTARRWPASSTRPAPPTGPAPAIPVVRGERERRGLGGAPGRPRCLRRDARAVRVLRPGSRPGSIVELLLRVHNDGDARWPWSLDHRPADPPRAPLARRRRPQPAARARERRSPSTSGRANGCSPRWSSSRRRSRAATSWRSTSSTRTCAGSVPRVASRSRSRRSAACRRSGSGCRDRSTGREQRGAADPARHPPGLARQRRAPRRAAGVRRGLCAAAPRLGAAPVGRCATSRSSGSRAQVAARLARPPSCRTSCATPLLAQHGGVYVDTDVECRKPLDELLTGVEAFAALELPGRLGTAVIGSVPDTRCCSAPRARRRARSAPAPARPTPTARCSSRCSPNRSPGSRSFPSSSSTRTCGPSPSAATSTSPRRTPSTTGRSAGGRSWRRAWRRRLSRLVILLGDAVPPDDQPRALRAHRAERARAADADRLQRRRRAPHRFRARLPRVAQVHGRAARRRARHARPDRVRQPRLLRARRAVGAGGGIARPTSACRSGAT